MPYDDLRDFIRALEKNKELKRISFEVDPKLEITEFADRSVKSGGPALLFENPKGSKIPVLINSFASMRRMEIALKVGSIEEIGGRISEYLEMRMPEGLLNKLKMLPKLAEIGAFFSEDCVEGGLPGGCEDGRLFALRLPGADLLAGRRRAVHHAADGFFA
jgi:4-hydroxy-3-polyprenylbenzoate decarboxylase